MHRLEKRKTTSTGTDDEEAKELLNYQSKVIEDEINKIKAGKHGRVTNVFKMREVVAGPKKQQQEAHAVKDPRTGETVVSCEDIKRVNLEHCVKVLKNNVPNKEVEELLKVQSERHDDMMLDDTDMETTIDKENFQEVVAKFKKKNKKSFHFLTKSGAKFQNSVFKLSKRMVDEESFPTDFAMTTLHQV
jgi:hypothetical protein